MKILHVVGARPKRVLLQPRGLRDDVGRGRQRRHRQGPRLVRLGRGPQQGASHRRHAQRAAEKLKDWNDSRRYRRSTVLPRLQTGTSKTETGWDGRSAERIVDVIQDPELANQTTTVFRS